jgi:hypothetical protein
MGGERIDAHCSFGDECECAFAADEQFGQVDFAIVEDTVKLVAAAVDERLRTAVFDKASVPLHQTADGERELAETVCGGAGLAFYVGSRLVERMPTDAVS